MKQNHEKLMFMKKKKKRRHQFKLMPGAYLLISSIFSHVYQIITLIILNPKTFKYYDAIKKSVFNLGSEHLHFIAISPMI